MSFLMRKAWRRRFLSCLFLMSFLLSLIFGHYYPAQGMGHAGTAQPMTVQKANQLVQQGVDLYQAGHFQGAIEPWQMALKAYQRTNDRMQMAIVWENLARAYQQLGQFHRSIDAWHQGIHVHRQLGDLGKVGRMLTEQAQAYSHLGKARRAIAILCHPLEQTFQRTSSEDTSLQCQPGSALVIAQEQGDHTAEVAAMGSLGNAYYARGKFDQALQWLKSGLAIAQGSGPTPYQATLLNSLGNAYAGRAQLNERRALVRRQITGQPRSQVSNALTLAKQGPTITALEQKAAADNATALRYFEQSFAIAQQLDAPLTMLQPLLNALPLYAHTPTQAHKIEAAQKMALTVLKRLPQNRDTVFATLNLARLLGTTSTPVTPAEPSSLRMAGPRCDRAADSTQVQTLLKTAVTTAQQIGDRRAESFALGELGHFYECHQHYAQALKLTQQARWASADLNNPDSLYLWEWQTGRILKAQKHDNQAIQSYERAIATLEDIRSDILSASRDLQFDFRDTIEPIYRELATLRLDRDSPTTAQPEAPKPQQNLTAALHTIDALKLAELQNYFGDDCVLTALPTTPVEHVDPGRATAVINTIIFPERTSIIVRFPDGHSRLEWVNLPAQDIQHIVNTYRMGLEKFYEPFDATSPHQAVAQTLYDWLIRPFETDLTAAQVKTLVFVQDGIFRSIPMAALHDGHQFLVQRYAIATTPSLQLTNPKTLRPQGLRAIMLGVTKAAKIEAQTFPALDYVSQELAQIRALLPESEQLMDQDFTSNRLQQKLSDYLYPIVHIATHAKFGPEPEATFLVTGDNQKLEMNDFDRMLRRVTGPREAIDLLTLTACQTAVGDDRAALGLAGVALQAGARSTMASLWFINDAATAQMTQRFYQELLQPGVNKAEALQAAQLELLEAGGKFAHPSYWAPFILIGNWL